MTAIAEHYRRPDFEAEAARMRGLAGACAEAATDEAFLDAVEEWNARRASFDTQMCIAELRYQQDTDDAEAKAEQDAWDAAAPLVRELDVLYARTLATHPRREVLERAYGAQLVRLCDALADAFDPAIAEDVAAEAKLVSRYVELLARREARFRDETLTLSELWRYYDDGDRQVRLDAHIARDRFLASYADELDAIFDELVTVRDRMGKALGHDGFIPLGYQLMRRTYGPEDVAAFRRAVRDKVVPLAAELRERQRQRLGLDALLFHDEPVRDPAGNPRPRGGEAAIVEGCRAMYRELHPETGAFLDLLDRERLLDLSARPGKAGGGFCTVFHDLGVPFIFANFTGSQQDVLTMTHEFGHAFQCYTSRDQRPRCEYAFPTYEAAEIHSMSMEMLTFPWMETFFGDAADRFRRGHLEDTVARIAYTAAVDHFQHEIYARPEMTPDERHAAWLEVERQYLPGRDYGGDLPHLARGTVWQRQRHIYCVPFYYIDYSLAQVCALQFWSRARADRDAALADYLAICRVGGSKSFQEIVALAGLRSPFDPSCLDGLVGELRAELLD